MLRVGVVLRVLSPVVHAVVTHYPHLPQPRASSGCPFSESLGRAAVAPGEHEDNVARAGHGVVNVPADQPGSMRVEPEPGGAVLGGGVLDLLGGLAGVEQGDGGGLAGLGLVEPLLGQGAAVGQAGVAGALPDAQVVVGQDVLAPLGLDVVVAGPGPPADQGLLVAPAGQGQDPAVPGQAAVADVVDEAVNLLELGAEHLGGG